MHKLLEQQLAKTIAPNGPFPIGWRDFLSEVENTYEQYEKEGIDRHSLEVSSTDVEKENRFTEERQEELERLNSLMIGRELKMVELKKTIEQLRKENELLRKGKTT